MTDKKKERKLWLVPEKEDEDFEKMVEEVIDEIMVEQAPPPLGVSVGETIRSAEEVQ